MSSTEKRTEEAVACGRCAWCLNDKTPPRRGYEKTCPHGYGCCQNCAECQGSEEYR